MISNKKILGIITARGGSKSLPGKNIKLFNGKPLIAYSIETALKSKYLDKVIVSTDNKEIAKIAKKFRAEVPFLRPKKFARDNSPSSEAILHAIDWLEKRNEFFDIIVLLQPTSPLRKENDVDMAIELFLKNYKKADSLVSVGKIHLENPYITKKIENGYVKPLIKIRRKIYQRQQLPEVYYSYGLLYLSKVDTYRKYKTFYQKRTIPYFIERWQNYEIDDIYDFIALEQISKYKFGNSR